MFARVLPLIFISVIIAIGYVALVREDVALTIGVPSRAAPALTIDTLDGYQSPILSSLKGRFVLVNFFASWCGPCEAEMGVLMDLPEGISVYGVAWRDKQETLTAWLEKMPPAYDYVAMDKNNETSIFYGSTGVPESFLISPSGQIVMHHAGPLTADVVAQILLPLMKKAEM